MSKKIFSGIIILCMSIVLTVMVMPTMASAASNSGITASEAKEIALNKTGGGTVIECDLDYEDGIRVYEIEIIRNNKKYEMDVGVYNSKIYNYEVETISGLTSKQAKKIALNKTSGGTVVKCKSEIKNGRNVYAIKIIKSGKRHTMNVGIENAKIYNYKSTSLSSSGLTSAEAKKIALAKTNGGTVKKSELATVDKRKVYKITITKSNKKYTMNIGVKNAKIYNYKVKNISSSAITADKAKEIALAKTGGGTVTKCKLDYENGVKVYEIDIIKGNYKYEIDVRVSDGTIVKYEKEYDDDHDDDD